MIMHLQDLNLSKDEKERVEALHETYGFIVYNAGFSCTMEEGRKVEMCYWRCLRGVRESALFPTHEAAWRDALQVHEEAVDAVKVNEGPSRRRTPSDLNILQGFKSQGMTWAQITEKSQYLTDLTDLMIKSGLSIDIRKATETYISLASEPLPIDAMKSTLECAGYKFHFTPRVGWYCEQLGHKNDTGSLGTAVKAAWKHALDNGGNEVDMVSVCHAYTDPEGVVKRFITAWDNAAKTDPAETSARAAGWTNFEDSEDASLLVVAHDNRDVHFTGPEAWEQAYQWEKDNDLWNGVGQPPVGTVLWITPHNTLWGFPEVGTYLCEVLAYRDEYVWLELLSDLGENTYTFTTTRIDKVDVKVWKGNRDA